MYVVKERSERYETVDKLADGAMGTVSLARDRLMDRLVAIKTVKLQGVTEPDERVRLCESLLSEAKVVQLLAHPNIVTVHDVIAEEVDQPPSLVMEYHPGTTLAALLKGGKPLPLDFALSVAQQIASALEHAHTMGVVHGDIKPSNILISEDDEQVKIVDFGIARLMDQDGARDDRVFGTPRYVSPEQLLGQQPGPRSDLFSLGVVLYEMLTGRSPFKGKTSGQITQQIVKGGANLSASALKRVPEEVQAVLRQALAKDPSARFHSAREMCAALRDPDEVEAESDAVTTQDLSELVVPEIPDVDPAAETSEIAAAEPEAVAQETVADEVSETAGDQTVPSAPVDAAMVDGPSPAVEAAASEGEHSVSAPDRPAAAARTPTAAPKRKWSLPLPSLSRRPFSLRRALLAGGVAAAVTLSIGLFLIWRVSPDGSADARYSHDYQAPTQLLPLLEEGQRQLRAGQPEVAARIFTRAAELAPQDPRIGRLHQQAQEELLAAQAEREQSEELRDLIARSREALDDGALSRALGLATQALSIDPENAEAQALADTARLSITTRPRAKPPTRQESQRQPKSIETRRRAPTVAPSQPEIQPAPPRPRPKAQPREPTPTSPIADLRVDVFSYLPKGVLTVYAGQEQVLLQPFRFVQKSGFLRRKKTAGRLETSVQVPSGPTEFRIYVSSDGQETQSVNLDADLAGGQVHTLRLIIAENGAASAQLN